MTAAPGQPFDARPTRAQIRRDVIAKLDDVSETPSQDADLLISDAVQCAAIDWLIDHRQIVSEAEQNAIASHVTRRMTGEPVAYILGQRAFWRASFAVGPSTLIPRADSETLVSAALDYMGDRMPEEILDLGTGTGCLLLSLLQEWPKARGIGVDVSVEALLLALENARALALEDRVTFLEGSWFAPLSQTRHSETRHSETRHSETRHRIRRFDVIVSNPPYVRSDEMPHLMRDVRDFEPALALDGGADGLDAYPTILSGAPAWLKPHGLFVLEIGFGQGSAVSKLAEDSGFRVLDAVPDLGGRPRALVLGLKNAGA